VMDWKSWLLGRWGMTCAYRKLHPATRACQAPGLPVLFAAFRVDRRTHHGGGIGPIRQHAQTVSVVVPRESLERLSASRRTCVAMMQAADLRNGHDLTL